MKPYRPQIDFSDGSPIATVVLREGTSLRFDILGASDGARLTVASKSDFFDARIEAVQNRIESEYRPRFARNYVRRSVA